MKTKIFLEMTMMMMTTTTTMQSEQRLEDGKRGAREAITQDSTHISTQAMNA